jgi:hypothetical protein
VRKTIRIIGSVLLMIPAGLLCLLPFVALIAGPESYRFAPWQYWALTLIPVAISILGWVKPRIGGWIAASLGGGFSVFSLILAIKTALEFYFMLGLVILCGSYLLGGILILLVTKKENG